jgi:hypothetical protein
MAICNRLNRKLRCKANAVEAQLKGKSNIKEIFGKDGGKTSGSISAKMKRKIGLP